MSVSVLAAVAATRSVREGLLGICRGISARACVPVRDALYCAVRAIDRRVRDYFFHPARSIVAGCGSGSVLSDL